MTTTPPNVRSLIQATSERSLMSCQRTLSLSKGALATLSLKHYNNEEHDDNKFAISFFAAQRVAKGVIYSIAKLAADHMAACMAHELREHNVAAVSLYPGLVRTEAVMVAAQWFDLSNSESPQFLGRAVAVLASDPTIMQKSGQVLVAAQVALDYGSPILTANNHVR